MTAHAPSNAIAIENHDNQKTLYSCGFLRLQKNRMATAKYSHVQRARASICNIVDRAMSCARTRIAHFLLTGFGVSCLLLYKLQRDARHFGCVSQRYRHLLIAWRATWRRKRRRLRRRKRRRRRRSSFFSNDAIDSDVDAASQGWRG